MSAGIEAESAQPLLGRRIVVTRPRQQAASLLRALEALGAVALALPTIETAPPADWRPLDRALARLDEFQGYIFTSANGVEAFFTRAAALGLAPRPAAESWICAIGPETARRLESYGWRPHLVPERFVAEGILETLSGKPLGGSRILIPRAAQARDVLPQELARAGADCEIIAVYQTRIPAEAARRAQSLFPAPPARPGADAVLFTSSSTAQHLAAILGADYARRLAGAALGAIGPITAATLQELGLRAAFVAEEYTAKGLVKSVIDYFRKL